MFPVHLGAMVTPKNVLLAAMLVLTAVYVAVWVSAVRARHARATESTSPGILHLAIGFVTNFFDTLGIGSFATTTTLYRLWRLVPDQLIPGTLNVGHTPPTIVQALIYITIVQVDFQTLLFLIIAAVGG